MTRSVVAAHKRSGSGRQVDTRSSFARAGGSVGWLGRQCRDSGPVARLWLVAEVMAASGFGIGGFPCAAFRTALESG